MSESSLREPNKVVSCLLEEGGVLEIRMWADDVVSGERAVLVVHDLWEDLLAYEQDIRWWLSQGRRVYGVQLDGDGMNTAEPFIGGSFRLMCINLLQVMARVRALEQMRAPLVYTKGLGALIVSKIVRKNAKFVAGMIAYAPMFFLCHPVKQWRLIALQSLRTMAPKFRVPRWLAPSISEVAVGEGFHHRERGRLRSEALIEYLRAMKQSRKLCARLNIPCLFIVSELSKVHDYAQLHLEQEKRQHAEEFQIVDTDYFLQVRAGALSDEEFDQWAEEVIVPWLDFWEQRRIVSVPAPLDTFLGEEESTHSFVLNTQAPLPSVGVVSVRELDLSDELLEDDPEDDELDHELQQKSV